ncbi:MULTISPECIES: transketolase family protein [unclassified Enterococcus]|uniref:transketolase family protein n=1 Tax=unclassified Enterococcus TaxID=2608891 RepID=UPI001CE0E12C|nr:MULTISPECIES: transketolase C-terminal domain-containing protein [unclassified Enterococcus]MCA5013974.1 transketolase family protein [Enterococcus sp. S23]MCA5017252.1 transketolase family protein [Enterococcus sp. S22(2020)]
MKDLEMRQVYTQTIQELAEKDKKILALEADLASSMGTSKLKEKLGDRYINVGIMEAQEMSAATGLAVTGFIPFIHTFAPFATRRSFDQVFLSLGYAKNHAVIVGTDPGVTAEMNGGTHMPFEDVALMRVIPGNNIYEVSDPYQFKAILTYAHTAKGLFYIRTIRKQAKSLYNEKEDFSKGYCRLKKGTHGTIFASGIMVEEALQAAEDLEEKGISVQVIDLFRIKPMNEEVVIEAAKLGPIITAENHNVIGGLGSAVAEIIAENHPTKMKRIGVKEQFGQVGKLDYLKGVYGLKANDISKAMVSLLD